MKGLMMTAEGFEHAVKGLEQAHAKDHKEKMPEPAAMPELRPALKKDEESDQDKPFEKFNFRGEGDERNRERATRRSRLRIAERQEMTNLISFRREGFQYP